MPNPHGNPKNLKHFQGKWNHGKTRTIRVPEVLADRVLAYARQIDQGIADPDLAEAIRVLKESLNLRANRGGAIKEKIRLALSLLRR